MNIGIAINGEGRGHFSRGRALAEILGKSHDISFWVPEHLAEELAVYFPHAKIFRIPYLKYIQRGFAIDYIKTIRVNAALFFYPYTARQKIARELRSASIEMVMSDFEPFTSAAAKIVGLPVLQLNHPGVVWRTFTCSLTSFIAQMVSLYMMANSDRTILCSFFNGDVGPIIRSELREIKVTRGDYFVVYQKDLYRDFLSPLLESLTGYSFRIFPDPNNDYAHALAGCRGLIAPAGHQSLSEALALGKPVFAIPVEGQFEQELNAQKLRESGFGDYCFYGTLSANLPRFLSSIDKFENAIRTCRMNGSSKKNKAWACRDETLKAAGLVERFIQESRSVPAWKRRTILTPLFQE
jgi:uncharacterized protein (TIGR00661 family)